MTTLQTRFGRALRRLRIQAGFNQESFAAHAGIDRSYYGRIERGVVNVSLSSIEKIAKSLKVNPSRIFSEAESDR